jgi:hypothetical protein
MMMKDITRWLGVTPFELVMIGVSLLIYGLLLTIKTTTSLFDTYLPLSYWVIHSPLFVADSLWSYFCTIVLIRQIVNQSYKSGIFRALWSFNQILLIFLFKLLLCFRLEGHKQISKSEIMSPLFVLFILLVIRGCQLL